MDLSDDDYEHVSDVDMCDSDGERPNMLHDSAPSSPPSLRSSQRKLLACSYQGCHKTFNRRSRLEEHIRSHENIRPFKCPYEGCDVTPYLRKSHLDAHIKSAHTGVRDYACTWEGCEKSFANGTRLRRHLAAHEGREKYRCRDYEGCNETFRKHETLKRHILSVHQQIRPYPCTEHDVKTGRQCGKAFDTMEKLRTHVRASHDPERYTCTDCLVVLSTAKTEGAQPPPEAQSHFTTYSELQAHIADVHPPRCEWCSLSFKTTKELNRHLELQHEVIDPTLTRDCTFTCIFKGCGRSFTKKGNLSVHVKTVHEKQKDYVCGQTMIKLPNELNGQANIEVYGCGRQFTSKATLEDHVRSAHLGLEQLQTERRRKRKAELSASQQVDVDVCSRQKKTRKDKGIKKTSAIAGLVGASRSQHASSQQGQAFFREYEYATPHEDDVVSIKGEDDGDTDDWNQLSGSMVMFGDHIYHNGHGYEYEHGQYPTGLSQSEPSRRMPQSPPPKQYLGNMNTFDEELMFDNFEHEPELMNGLHNVDPVLLRS